MDYFDVGFSVRKPAWHLKAKVLDEYPGREEAIVVAGHNFQIEEKKFSVEGVEVDGWKALRRDDSHKILSVVRDSYEVVQNTVLWDIVDAIIKQPNVKYETAGVLKDGTILWVLARLDMPTTIGGDNCFVMPYCLVSTTHDGTGATRAGAVSVRVVCWNTYSAAWAEAAGSGKQYTFKHTKKVMDRIGQAREALGIVKYQHEEFLHLCNELAETPVSKEAVKEFIARFIPEPAADVCTDRMRTNIILARQKVDDLLNGVTVADAHRRTAYGLWCAGVEYLDHVRKYRSDDTYFKRTMYATSGVKDRVRELVLECAKN